MHTDVTIRYYVVDAFASKACEGNPAAVVVLPRPHIIDDRTMQRIAMEINLSETAFTWSKSEAIYAIRYFTPTKEIELCGHATMATAKVLYDIEHVTADPSVGIQFDTCFGESLYCKYEDEEIIMAFPSDANVMRIEDCGIENALDKDRQANIMAVYEGRFDIMVVMKHWTDVQDLEVDMNALEAVTLKLGKRGVIVTSAADESTGVDFVSRFFAPAAGIPEDPVTGSAHCTLGPFWEGALKKTAGSRLLARQIGPKRQGRVGVRSIDDATVEISGNAVIVSETTFYPSMFD